MKFKTIAKPVLNWLWQVAPWLVDRITGKPRSPEEMKADLNRAKRKADESVEDALDKKFGED